GAPAGARHRRAPDGPRPGAQVRIHSEPRVSGRGRRDRRLAGSDLTIVAAAFPQVYAVTRTVEMPFALKLRELLSFRENMLPGEFDKGDTLESVLDNYL